VLLYLQIHVQGVVDHEQGFISYETGFPSSMTDVTIWKKSHIWVHCHEYFNDGECLLGDKGMFNTALK
jgi:hypothetical protein